MFKKLLVVTTLWVSLCTSGYALSWHHNNTCTKPTHSGVVRKANSGCFDYYTLTQTWTPQFCAKMGSRHRYQVDCKTLSNTWAATHLGVHGLWPQYDDVNHKTTYPSNCLNSLGCHDKWACSLNINYLTQGQLATLKRLMAIAYMTLLQHEWTKHGTCSGLNQRAYFTTLINYANKLKTPVAIQQAVGKSISYAKLVALYGGDNYVSLNCDHKGGKQYLLEVRTFWSKSGERIANPSILHSSSCSHHKPIYIRAAH